MKFNAFTVLAVLAAALLTALPVEARPALEKYDPVAYFTQNAAVRGSDGITYEWQGQTWYFSSEENKSMFTSDPEKYAPQYHGYCAFAVSQGALAPSDPQAFSIVNGKLYLNFNQGVRQKWESSRDALIRSGDQKWPSLKSKLP